MQSFGTWSASNRRRSSSLGVRMRTTSARPWHAFARLLQKSAHIVCQKAASLSEKEQITRKPSARFVLKITFSVYSQIVNRRFLGNETSAGLPLSSTRRRGSAAATGRGLDPADVSSCSGVAIAPDVLGANTKNGPHRISGATLRAACGDQIRRRTSNRRFLRSMVLAALRRLQCPALHSVKSVGGVINA